MRFGAPVVGEYADVTARRSVTHLRLPTRLGVPSKLIRFPNALRRAGCPRSSPRRFAANMCGITRRDARVPVRVALRQFFKRLSYVVYLVFLLSVIYWVLSWYVGAIRF
jgi:hypothetical protein